MTRRRVSSTGTGATANLEWFGSSALTDVKALEALFAGGLTWVVTQEARQPVHQLLLKRNPHLRLLTDLDKPAHRPVVIIYDGRVLTGRYAFLEVKIGWLGRLGAGEDSIRVKVIPIGCMRDRETGQYFEILGGHNIASAWRKWGRDKGSRAEQLRRLYAWHKFNRAWFGRVKANRRRGVPTIGGQDGNGVIGNLAGYVARGWSWATYDGKSHWAKIDWLGATKSFTLDRGQLFDPGTASDHRWLVVGYRLTTWRR